MTQWTRVALTREEGVEGEEVRLATRRNSFWPGPTANCMGEPLLNFSVVRSEVDNLPTASID
jgi:hypothetical protein